MVDRTHLPPTRTEAESETLDLPEGLKAFRPGQILGERYQIVEMLGRGGMGEVWHAFDLKLRVDVALKVLRSDLFKSERRRELLRSEVRAAREVISPNVCRIFDLIEIEDVELVSMEFVDGATLLAVLHERGPLELKEAQDIASQFLAGLEAIHSVGLVHRDIKPENIMLTRTGRVVVMDFGIARQEMDGGGTVSGTPAYMPPEQAEGQAVDARADVYAAGVVLAEMVSPDGISGTESRRAVWEGIRRQPAQLPESPWAAVLQKAVANDRSGRFSSAHTLTRALEEVTLRVDGAEDLHPYPGLESFTQDNAEYFFGREAEIEKMWRKLEGPARMLALAGPSGAGKSSFLKAGLLPSKRPNWAHVICTPGTDPQASLRRAMIEELQGDKDALRDLAEGAEDATVSAASRWQSAQDHTLIIVDQFEELFTLNDVESQKQFGLLLARLVLDENIYVLLSMRDDFLFHCHRLESLRPVLPEMTMIGPPEGLALRRALVQPAMKCGYRFEDEELVEEMLAEVKGERGALPLLAFAAAQQWENRDREIGQLTRQAYLEIGGVGGALAQHAEETIDRIGTDRISVVRELFRNLVTAEGTRAVREWDELLSIFSDSNNEPSEDVLLELIDARLLTSYEIREDDEAPKRMVEIIHESLLANWPRLVRWQTQDADGAQLRDQLRQAARTWAARGRPDDLLWSGSAFLEFSAWHNSYPGGLTEIENEFANAMRSHTNRRKRRRQLMTAAGVAFLVAVLAIVSGLWRQSVQQTRLAEAEAKRAEASKLLTLGESALDEERTHAIAFVLASLELSDSPEARRLALESLWAGPPATVIPGGEGAWALTMSPNGRHLAAGFPDGVVRVYPSDGGPPVRAQGMEGGGFVTVLQFSPDDRQLIGGSGAAGGDVFVWEKDPWHLARTLPTIQQGTPDYMVAYGVAEPDSGAVLTMNFLSDKSNVVAGSEDTGHWNIQRWPRDVEQGELIAEVPGTSVPLLFPDFSRGLFAMGDRNEVHLYDFTQRVTGPGRIIGRHSEVLTIGSIPAFDPVKDRLAICDTGGNLLLWPLDGDGRQPDRQFAARGEPNFTAFSPDGRLLAQTSRSTGHWIWNLNGPAGVSPIRFDTQGPQMNQVAFSPDGSWMVTSGGSFHLALWPLSDRYSRILHGHDDGTAFLAFSPDGSTLFTLGHNDGTVFSWPLVDGAGLDPVELFRGTRILSTGLAIDADGQFLVATSAGTRLIPVNGETPEILDGFSFHIDGFVFDPSNHRLAINVFRQGSTPTMTLLDLETRESLSFDPPGDGNVSTWDFDSTGHLLLTRGGLLSRWNPETRTSTILINSGVVVARAGPNENLVYIQNEDGHSILNLTDDSQVSLASHGEITTIAFGPNGLTVVTGGPGGDVRVGSITGDVPHLLLGHQGSIRRVYVSPDRRWVASLDENGEARLWPMPDLTEHPLHTIAHEEFISYLENLTNLRAITDDLASTGYRLEADFAAYRGWSHSSEW